MTACVIILYWVLACCQVRSCGFGEMQMVRILVVDDDKNTRRLLEAVLAAENYTVFTATNGEEALQVMDREHIDLVVLDIMMPKMDGYEFTRILRE